MNNTRVIQQRIKVVAVVAATVLTLVGCSETTTSTSQTSTRIAATTTTEPAPPPAPTDAEVVAAFQAYIKERADSGVMLADAVTSVTSVDGVVTVTMDASPVVLEASPYDNYAELFGTPAAFNDDEGVWLRQTVQRVDVVDASGQSLGSMTAAELNQRAAG